MIPQTQQGKVARALCLLRECAAILEDEMQASQAA
jgi:hypothetical protein